MSTRSGVLGRAASTSSPYTTTLVTVAATDTLIVKEVDLINIDTVGHFVSVYGQNSLGTVFGNLFYASINAATRADWKGWFALGPGDSLIFNSSGPSVHCWASGADLPGHI